MIEEKKKKQQALETKKTKKITKKKQKKKIKIRRHKNQPKPTYLSGAIIDCFRCRYFIYSLTSSCNSVVNLILAINTSALSILS